LFDIITPDIETINMDLDIYNYRDYIDDEGPDPVGVWFSYSAT